MEERLAGKNHKIIMNNRRDGSITGVIDVISFDVEEIKVETEMGTLLIKGSELHVKRLNLEKGEVDIEGRIDSIAYTHIKNKSDEESFLSRMFK